MKGEYIMRFREIRNREITRDKKEEDSFLQIKPEGDMTVQDARNFWDNLFNKSIERAEKVEVPDNEILKTVDDIDKYFTE